MNRPKAPGAEVVAPVVLPVAGPSPLDESQFAQVRQAVVAHRAVKKVCRTALTSSIITLGIGIFSVPFLFVWPSWSAVMVVTGLCVIGAVEFVGYRRLREGRPEATQLLALNQIALLIVVSAYFASQMVSMSGGGGLSPEFRSQFGALGDTSGLEQTATTLARAVYGILIVVTIISQGAMALYYRSRRKHIEAFNRATPDWIRRLFIEMGA